VRVVYKYSIPRGVGSFTFTLNLPGLVRFLHVDLQNGEPKAWFEVDEASSHSEHHFRIVGTGDSLGDWACIGTWQDPPYVWHLCRPGAIAWGATASRPAPGAPA